MSDFVNNFWSIYVTAITLGGIIGCLLLLLGTLEGFTGYSLPDDLLSGTGLQIARGIVQAIQDIRETDRALEQMAPDCLRLSVQLMHKRSPRPLWCVMPGKSTLHLKRSLLDAVIHEVESPARSLPMPTPATPPLPAPVPGDRVALNFAAAGRDPEACDHPGTFDPTRGQIVHTTLLL